jgi:hypothetical protein
LGTGGGIEIERIIENLCTAAVHRLCISGAAQPFVAAFGQSVGALAHTSMPFKARRESVR